MRESSVNLKGKLNHLTSKTSWIVCVCVCVLPWLGQGLDRSISTLCKKNNNTQILHKQTHTHTRACARAHPVVQARPSFQYSLAKQSVIQAWPSAAPAGHLWAHTLHPLWKISHQSCLEGQYEINPKAKQWTENKRGIQKLITPCSSLYDGRRDRFGITFSFLYHGTMKL